MNTFQFIYIALCIPMALLDMSDLYRRHPFPQWLQEAIFVIMIVSWPVWILPMAIYAAVGHRKHNR